MTLFRCKDCGGVFGQDESDTEFCPGCQYEKDREKAKEEKLKDKTILRFMFLVLDCLEALLMGALSNPSTNLKVASMLINEITRFKLELRR